jgi:hypothetical protein
MALCGQVVDLAGLDLLKKGDQATSVCEVSVMQDDAVVRIVLIATQMIYA